MWPFKRQNKKTGKRPLDQRQVQTLVFLGEQDGPPERELKNQLVAVVLGGSQIQRAYLARIEADGERCVALCLRGPADMEIVRQVFGVFGGIFGAHEHLDTLFLDESEEHDLRRVCAPFYSNHTH